MTTIGNTGTSTVTGAATSTAAGPGGGAKEAAKEDEATASSAIAADFQTFLTLLTTQLKNQDPLSPTDSTEYMSQLASFSGVEQQVRTNNRLDTIISVLGNGSSAGLAEWIGREVRAPAEAAYSGEAIEVGFTPAAGADKAVLVVTNAFGTEVARRTLAGDADEATWDGKDDLGNAAAYGDYAFTVESYEGETLLGTQAGSVYATVREVRIADGEATLIVGDGEEVALDSITGFR